MASLSVLSSTKAIIQNAIHSEVFTHDIQVNSVNHSTDEKPSQFICDVNRKRCIGMELMAHNIPKTTKAYSDRALEKANVLQIATWPGFIRGSAENKQLFVYGRGVVSLAVTSPVITGTPSTDHSFLNATFDNLDAPFLSVDDIRVDPLDLATQTTKQTFVGFIDTEFARSVAYEKSSKDGIIELLSSSKTNASDKKDAHVVHYTSSAVLITDTDLTLTEAPTLLGNPVNFVHVLEVSLLHGSTGSVSFYNQQWEDLMGSPPQDQQKYYVYQYRTLNGEFILVWDGQFKVFDAITGVTSRGRRDPNTGDFQIGDKLHISPPQAGTVVFAGQTSDTGVSQTETVNYTSVSDKTLYLETAITMEHVANAVVYISVVDTYFDSANTTHLGEMHYEPGAPRRLNAIDAFVPNRKTSAPNTLPNYMDSVNRIEPRFQDVGYANFTNFLRCALLEWGHNYSLSDAVDNDSRHVIGSPFAIAIPSGDATDHTVRGVSGNGTYSTVFLNTATAMFEIIAGTASSGAKFSHETTVTPPLDTKVCYVFYPHTSDVDTNDFDLLGGIAPGNLYTIDTTTYTAATLGLVGTFDLKNDDLVPLVPQSFTSGDLNGTHRLYMHAFRPGLIMTDNTNTKVGVITGAHATGGLRVHMLHGGQFSVDDTVTVGESAKSRFERELMDRWFDYDIDNETLAEFDTHGFNIGSGAGQWNNPDHFKLFQRDPHDIAGTSNVGFNFATANRSRGLTVQNLSKSVELCLFLNQHPEVFYNKVDTDGNLTLVKINKLNLKIPSGDIDTQYEKLASEAFDQQMKRHMQKIAKNMEAHKYWPKQIVVVVSGQASFAVDNSNRTQLGYSMNFSFYYLDELLFDYDTIIVEIVATNNTLGLTENQVALPTILNAALYPDASDSIIPVSGDSFVRGSNIDTLNYYIRGNRGSCLGHNVLFMYITVASPGDMSISSNYASRSKDGTVFNAASEAFAVLYLTGHCQTLQESMVHGTMFQSSMDLTTLKIEFKNKDDQLVDFEGQDVYMTLRLHELGSDLGAKGRDILYTV